MAEDQPFMVRQPGLQSQTVKVKTRESLDTDVWKKLVLDSDETDEQ